MSTPTPPAPGASDPSMEDILASIRRILSEDEPTGEHGAAPHEVAPAPSDVLTLDSSMMVQEPAVPVAHSPAPVHLEAVNEPPLDIPPPPGPEALPERAAPVAPPPVMAPPQVTPPIMAVEPAPRAPVDNLVAPAAAAAVASTVGSLMRHLAQERQAAVHRGGPTIEDLVREEIRPLLKEWLDAHLPSVVENLVRAEIERVVGRSVG